MHLEPILGANALCGPLAFQLAGWGDWIGARGSKQLAAGLDRSSKNPDTLDGRVGFLATYL